MSTPKSKPAPKMASVSRGAEIAAKHRTQANTLTDSARREHRQNAMSLIYGNAKPAHVRSR
jgi:hypothetical protein